MSTLIPAEFKDEPSLAGIKDVPSLVKGFVHAQRMVGQDKVVLPRSDWGEKDYNEFYGRLGRPETPDKYGMPSDMQLHESIKVDDAALAAAQQEFHRLGLTAKQGEAMLGYYFKTLNDRVSGMETERTTAQETATAALKTEWGDKYDANLAIAQRALKAFGSEELSQHLVESGLGDDPRMVRLFHKIGSSMGEDQMGRGGEGGGAPLSAEQALSEISKIRAMDAGDEWKRFMGVGDQLPMHKRAELQTRWNELHAKAAALLEAQQK
jgi:hypothetical protein